MALVTYPSASGGTQQYLRIAPRTKESQSRGGDTTYSRVDKTVINKRQKMKMPCYVCKKKYSSIYALQRHQRIHNGTLLSCSVCVFQTCYSSCLKWHMNSTHAFWCLKNLNCRVCNEWFFLEKELAAHHDEHLPFGVLIPP